jgi:hypothetical protein
MTDFELTGCEDEHGFSDPMIAEFMAGRHGTMAR